MGNIARVTSLGRLEGWDALALQRCMASSPRQPRRLRTGGQMQVGGMWSDYEEGSEFISQKQSGRKALGV
jgi:hypothetical protein